MDGRDACRQAQCLTTESARETDLLHLRHHFPSAHHCTDRKAVRHALTERREIRSNSKERLSSPKGKSKSRYDLIECEQGPMPSRQVGYTLQEALSGKERIHRLHYHARKLVRMLHKQLLKRA